MFYMRLADLNVAVKEHFPTVKMMCKDYLIPEPEHLDLSVSTTKEEVMAEGVSSELPMADRPDYLETLAIYRKIADGILDYDGFLMHGAVIEAYGQGIMFTAKSGTGKSTHINLWRKCFGEKCIVINGDKPLIRIFGGKAVVYGTPWAGKEGWQTNRSAPLSRVCFVERGAENKIEPISKKEAFTRLQSQVHFPTMGEKFAKTLELLQVFIAQTEFYVLRCNMELEAAEVAARGMGVLGECEEI